jgi:hypothetical protein
MSIAMQPGSFIFQKDHLFEKRWRWSIFAGFKCTRSEEDPIDRINRSGEW